MDVMFICRRGAKYLAPTSPLIAQFLPARAIKAAPLGRENLPALIYADVFFLGLK